MRIKPPRNRVKIAYKAAQRNLNIKEYVMAVAYEDAADNSFVVNLINWTIDPTNGQITLTEMKEKNHGNMSHLAFSWNFFIYGIHSETGISIYSNFNGISANIT